MLGLPRFGRRQHNTHRRMGSPASSGLVVLPTAHVSRRLRRIVSATWEADEWISIMNSAVIASPRIRDLMRTSSSKPQSAGKRFR